MKPFYSLVFFAVLTAWPLKLKEATQTPIAATDVRTWRDSTGNFRIRAKLVAVADGKVTLRKEDNSEVPLSRLSAEDRDFLKQRE